MYVVGSVILQGRLSPSKGENSGKSAENITGHFGEDRHWRGFPGDDWTD
jgi:hypothetical protein